MKALSILQPWAWLIVNADRYPRPKRVENRTWPTSFRGPLLIHAGKGFDFDGYEHILDRRPGVGALMPGHAREFERGGIVGKAVITGNVRVTSAHRIADPWCFGPWAFTISNPEPLPFVPWRGALGFFEVDDWVLLPKKGADES